MPNERVPVPAPQLSEGFLNELRTIQEESEATAFGLECREREVQRERELQEREAFQAQIHSAQKRHQRTDDITSEILETFASVGAGGLSTVEVGGVPVGPVLNYVIGSAAKAASVSLIGKGNDPNTRAFRVMSRAGKVLLHSQMSITARNLIVGKG